MKIHFDKTGAVPAAPDFALLRAGLLAAQQVTPTALAQALPHPDRPPSAHEKLIDLFNGEGAGPAASFNAAVARCDREEI